jgi:hypothetical protein
MPLAAVKIDVVSQRGGLCRARDDSYRTKNSCNVCTGSEFFY